MNLYKKQFLRGFEELTSLTLLGCQLPPVGTTWQRWSYSMMKWRKGMEADAESEMVRGYRVAYMLWDYAGKCWL